MHSQLSDCESSDDSMEHPITMKSQKPSSKRRRHSKDPSELMSDVTCLRNEFLKIYETDYPELQKCIDKLYDIVKTFEENFRQATAETRNGGLVAVAGSMVGAVGGVSAAGTFLGLALAPFTFGASIGLAVAGASAAVGGGVYGGLNSSKKTKQKTQIRKDIEAELKKFQDKINPMSEKMKEINKRIEEILRDLDKLELEAGEAGEDLGSRSLTRRIPREEMTAMNAQIAIALRMLGSMSAIFSAGYLFLDTLTVIENTKELNEMEELARKPLNEPIDETKIKTKAGQFIVERRKVIHKLENIMEEIRKSKDKLVDYFG